MPDPQKPSIGRIVHVHLADKADPVPAIITKVFSDVCVNLTAFTDDSATVLRMTSVLAGDGPGQWLWPPRV